EQSKVYTPAIERSGIIAQLKNTIGSLLLNNQSIIQWVFPFFDYYDNLIKPTYLTNNIVSINQCDNSTVAIFKRITSGISSPIITGYNYLWKITGLGGLTNYSNLSIGDLYPPFGTF